MLFGPLPGLLRAGLVRTTVGTRPVAEALARRLVQERLAACVHVTEAASTYRWDDRLQQETEYLVEARTLPGRPVDAVAEAMLRGHPYSEPMVEVLTSLVTPRYQAWMKREVG